MTMDALNTDDPISHEFPCDTNFEVESSLSQRACFVNFLSLIQSAND